LKQSLISAKDMIKNLVLNKNTTQTLVQRYCSALKILSQMEVNFARKEISPSLTTLHELLPYIRPLLSESQWGNEKIFSYS